MIHPKWIFRYNRARKIVAFEHRCPWHNKIDPRLILCPICDAYVCQRCRSKAPEDVKNLGWLMGIVEKRACGPCWKAEEARIQKKLLAIRQG